MHLLALQSNISVRVQLLYFLNERKFSYLDYHCGSSEGWSALYYFKTIPVSSNNTLSFAIYGDLGNINARALPQLQQEAQRAITMLLCT